MVNDIEEVGLCVKSKYQAEEVMKVCELEGGYADQPWRCLDVRTSDSTRYISDHRRTLYHPTCHSYPKQWL